MVKIKRISLVFLSFLLAIQTGLGQTANNSIPSYSSPFQYGVNGAYAGSNWTDQSLAHIASNAGSNSIRVGLYDSFLEQYGNNVRTSAFNYYTNTLHFSDNIVFLNGAANDHVDMTTYPGCSQHSMVFKNIYQPIWNTDANGHKTVNPTNYFAQYVFNVVSTYGQNIKFYEIWNEPDFTYTGNGYAKKGTPGNWFDNNPAAADLTNIQAPVFYYIRMLHIAYEVIKSVSPNSMVATGGLGYSSFLDVILRNTDNPDNGKVTADYPVTGGAYFDVLSFHSYPFYELGQWSNAQGKMVYTRSSDGNANRFLVDKQSFNTVLSANQYDGSKFPGKYFICTETNVPSKSNPSNVGQYGTPELQRNYIIKTMVNAQVNGVKQLYLYALDNGPATDPSNMNDVMGMYTFLYNLTQGQEKLTDEGLAFKTVASQLKGLIFDAGLTSSLKLPAAIGGGVFSGIQNSRQVQKICIWARTTLDQSEAASASISIPASFGNSFKQYAWNVGSDTTAYNHITGNTLTLTGAPVFLSPVSAPASLPVTITANAGSNATITLPTNIATLDGSASVAKNTTITSYSWIKTQGNAATVQSANTLKPIISGLTQGTYIFQLTVSDNSQHSSIASVTITVNAAAPVAHLLANAGINQSITLPVNSVNLDGTASTSQNTVISAYLWKQLLGPSNAQIANSSSAKTTVSSLIAGKYIFLLLINDKNRLTDSTSITIIVNPATLVASVKSNAGPDQTISAPATTTTLVGSGSTASNTTISTYRWMQLSGPGNLTWGNTTTVNINIGGLVPGKYVFELIVADNLGHRDSSRMNLTASSSATVASLTANAGPDQLITLPLNTGTLNGSASRATNTTISSYRWKELTGPIGLIWGNTTTVNTNIGGLMPGKYVFELIIADNLGHRDSSRMNLTVSSSATVASLTANAGPDQLISLPLNNSILNGSASRATNTTISSYRWKELTGPIGLIWGNTTNVNTNIGGLVPGKYVFELTVADNAGHRDSSTMILTVNKAQAIPVIISNAGINQTIKLPSDTARLDGSKSNAINTVIAAYRWKELSGPSNLTWQNTTTQNTRVGNLTAGIYLFELIVNDDNGHRDSSLVTVNVLNPVIVAINKPIIAHAGVNQVINLPSNSAILDGSGSTGGTDLTYTWKEISGPTNALIVNPQIASTTVSGLISGTYKFELILQNLSGIKDSASIIIIVNGATINSFLLYPNPVVSTATIKASFPETGIATIGIFSTGGVRVFKQQINKPDTFMSASINLSYLSPGIYILRMDTGTNVKVVRFIKK